MKILVVHNAYQERGGEDSVVANELALLNKNGHQTTLYSVDNSSISSIYDRIKTALNLTYSIKSQRAIEREIARVKPDVVHVHNFFPLVTPSVYDACLDAQVPAIQTLHNYRIACANALLLRNGQICELCMKHSPYQAVRYRCYRNSLIGSAAVAHMIDSHRKKTTWRKATKLIALTKFAKSRFIECGIPEEQLVVKPNFLPNPPSRDSVVSDRPGGALFVGRFSEEKGLATLLEGWKKLKIPLKIIGDGPLREFVESNCRPNIEFLGSLSPSEVRQQMLAASFLIVPSIWYEGFPMVIAEAYAHGLPVVASRIGSLSELVSEETGNLFDAGNADALVDAALRTSESLLKSSELRANVRNVFDREYSEARNIEILNSIYNEAIKGRTCAPSF